MIFFFNLVLPSQLDHRFLKGRVLILRLYLPFPLLCSFHQNTVYCTLLFNGLVCWMSALSFYMLHYLAGDAILYSSDHEPKGGDPGGPWGRGEEAGPPPQKGSDSACPLEAAVGLVLESQQALWITQLTPPQESFGTLSLS